MSKLLENLSDLNDLVIQGKAMEAFEKYYHNNVVMKKNGSFPTMGKEANRKRVEELFSSITEFRFARPLKVMVGEGCTMVQWHFDYTHKDLGVQNFIQVSVQEWQDDKIIKEQIYHGN